MSVVSELPIGVFDSGLGGLTVLKSLRERFPNENFVYLGDTARIPYGTKSPRTIAKYLEQNVKYLVRTGVKAIVIACNSASTVSDQVLSPVPIYNVIGPGAETAIKSTQSGVIGIIATRATVASKSYVTHLSKLKPDLKIYQQAAPLLVPLVEEGWDDDPITNLIVHRYVQPLMAAGIDTIILGCTHYPILKNSVRKVVGNYVAIVESGSAVCDKLEADFLSGKLQARVSTDAKSAIDPLRTESEKTEHIRLLTTDVSDIFQAQAKRIMAPLTIGEIELIDLVI